MIGIARGTEPSELTEARFRRLAAAILSREEHGGALPRDYDFTGYEVARDKLYWAQHQKCAYCERPQGEKEQPREHFRPKDGAQRVRGAMAGDGAGQWDRDYYWWLAWTWENLLFSCKTCNGGSHKGNYFPISGDVLASMQFDLTKECALVADPSRDDPLDHVRWRPRNPNAPRLQWEWFPYAVGSKGEETIEAFKMCERDLTSHVTTFIKNELLSKIATIELRLAQGKLDVATLDWTDVQESHLHDAAPCVGAKWCALTYLRSLPNSPLAALPEPRRPGRHDPWAVPVGLPPAPASIPDPAWIRLLAGEQIDNALVEILRLAPKTVKELLVLLKTDHSRYTPTKRDLKDTLDALVRDGRLSPIGDTYEAFKPVGQEYTVKEIDEFLDILFQS